MNIENLTREQKAELKRQLEAEEKAEKARVQRERENYKQLVDGWVEDKVKQLQNVSSIMMDAKADIFATAQTIISMKGDLFKVRSTAKAIPYPPPMEPRRSASAIVSTRDGMTR